MQILKNIDDALYSIFATWNELSESSQTAKTCIHVIAAANRKTKSSEFFLLILNRTLPKQKLKHLKTSHLNKIDVD